MKTVFKLLLLAALVGYLVFVFVRVPGRGDESVCRQVNFSIADSLHAGFITAAEAERLLKRAHLYPVGQTMEQIDGLKIEQALKRNEFIEEVSCYKSGGGTVNVLIRQRLPLLRVMADNGDDYYLDSKGGAMPPKGYVADLIVATGKITRPYAKKQLVRLGFYLRDHKFWHNQIEQIEVDERGELTLVPRVGAHLIQFGRPDSIETKFRNLHAFYQKVMPQVGWNKYEIISVEHPTQIICQKPARKKRA